jgi:hypothetical protein
MDDDLEALFAKGKRILLPGRKLLRAGEFALPPVCGDVRFLHFLMLEAKSPMTLSHYSRWFTRWKESGLTVEDWIIDKAFTKRTAKTVREGLHAVVRWRAWEAKGRPRSLSPEAFNQARERGSGAAHGTTRVLAWSTLGAPELVRLTANDLDRRGQSLGLIVKRATSKLPDRWIPVHGPGAESLRDCPLEGPLFEGKWWPLYKNFENEAGVKHPLYAAAYLRDAYDIRGAAGLGEALGYPYAEMLKKL